KKENESKPPSSPGAAPDVPPASVSGAGDESPPGEEESAISGSGGRLSAGDSGAARSGPALPAWRAKAPQQSSGEGMALKAPRSALARSGRPAVPAGPAVRVGGVSSSCGAVRDGEGGVPSRGSSAGRPAPTRNVEAGGPVSGGVVSVRDKDAGAASSVASE